ncbi:MAG: FAD:protein FMN transferase, partial [Gemmatimonadota bacterium]
MLDPRGGRGRIIGLGLGLGLAAAVAVPVGAQTAVATAAAGDAAEIEVRREAFVMGTRLGVRVRDGDPGAAEAALSAVREVEALLSTWDPATELSALNRAPVGAAHALTPGLAEVLTEAGHWVAATDGAFDPAIGALVEAWDLRGEGRVPTTAELAVALEQAGWDRLRVSDRTATRTAPGLWLDAGGFGKGLALREAVSALRSRGATGMLNFGGQVVAVGAGPVVIGVADARNRDRSVVDLALVDASVATTSSSERGDHVLDPRTGRPVPAWGSVTVVAEDPLVADILSTALYVMGPEAALAWARERPYGVLVQDRTDADLRLAWNPALERWLVDPAVAGAAGERSEPADRAAAVRSVAAIDTPVAAQDTSELARLRRQVEAITRELERIRLGGDVVRADTGVLGFGPAASKVYKVEEGVSIGGYGEILYRSISDELEDGTASPTTDVFDALRAILYVGYKFNDRLLFNSEIEIEHADEAYLEFAYLDYVLSDAVGLRGGLLLSPMGLVNELHEPPVFLGTTRPLVEQAVIPTTWRENGLGVFGDVGPVSYRVYAMNGLNGPAFSDAGLRGGRQKGSSALAEDVALVARADYTGVLGLLLGGSVYYGGSGQGTTVDGDVVQANTLIWEGHASYQARGWDLRALVAGATVDEAGALNAAGATGVAERLGGGYGHVGFDVLRFADTDHQLFPYVRYEWLDTQADVPTGVTADPAMERTAVLVGASWKPVPEVAVKGDYQIHSNGADTGRNQFALVLSW